MAKFKPSNWEESYRWHFEAYPFFCSVYQKVAQKIGNKYYVYWDKLLNYYDKDHVVLLCPKKSLAPTGNMIIKELMAGNDSFLNEFKKVHNDIKSTISLCLKIRKNGGFKDLGKWWPKLEATLSDVSRVLFSFDYTIDDFLKKLQTVSPKDFSALKASIRSKTSSFIDDADKFLIKLDKKHRNNFNKVYENFIHEYGWFQNTYKGIFKIEKPWLKRHLKELKFVKKHADPLSSSRLPKKYSLIAKTAKVGITLRDDKKKLLLAGVDLMEKWLRQVCVERGWKFEEMRWLSMDEVLEALETGDKKILARAGKFAREAIRCGVMKKDGYIPVARSLFKKADSIPVFGAKEIISGVAAGLGKISGKVKIILDPKKDGINFKKGDILVTSMTRPEFLPLMRKASAFVTDEGGITCHAAIVAREMGKPCIIGTKIATKILKDGQTVEVDADKGIINIL